MKKIMLIIALILYLYGVNCYGISKDEEVRAVWIATVYNMNWPKTSNPKSQKMEMVKNLDLVKSLGFNRVYFQIRCRGDSMYQSDMFPWSKSLTGKLGQNPGWDPLEFMIGECKKRGIILEAWINPFLLGHQSGGFKISDYVDKLPERNPLKTNTNWILKSENGYYLLNPGIPEVRDIVINEVSHIIKKYKVNIHIDDYFYPYPENKDSTVVLYDSDEFLKFGNGMSIDDWRRNNIDIFIKNLSSKIKSIDRSLTFSVSPFAIWKNLIKESGCGTNGLESYYTIYSNSVKWVKENWVDYVIPQIYWNIGFKIADYKLLAKWWNDIVESTRVKLIIGIAAYKLDPNSPIKAFRSSKEISNQIELNRTLKNISGYAIFSLNALKDNVLNINHIFGKEEIKC